MEMPAVVRRVMEDKDGRNPTFFAEKKLTYSDTTQRHNRLLFRQFDVINRILPLLSEVERETVMRGTSEGLRVELYTINGWNFQVFLRRRPSKGFVLKGTQWRNAVVFGELRVDDHVQLWSFRKRQDDTLCLIILKI